MDIIRKATNSLKPEDAVEKILDLFARTRNNREFVENAKRIRFFSRNIRLCPFVPLKGRGFQPEALPVWTSRCQVLLPWLLLHGVTGC